MCPRTRALPLTRCLDAGVWGRACNPPHDEDQVEVPCSDECREEDEKVKKHVEEWGREKWERERDEAEFA